ncbi:peptide chain release factor 2 [Candidatus Margulisiibacteriota bacterium]
MLYEIKRELNTYKEKYHHLGEYLDIEGTKEKVRQIEAEISESSFWDENAQAQDIFLELSQLKQSLGNFQELERLFEDSQIIIDLLEEEAEPNGQAVEEAREYLNKIKVKVDELEIKSLLSQKYDTYNCIINLNSGAGGTDAQDWAQMLLRMYLRWMDKNKFNYEVADEMYGDEAGIKSATVIVKGSYAYGLLKNEIGVHRLVRLSPYNANNKRQTSFAAVDVIPEIESDVPALKIDPKELRVETFRASGAGGQHVNKTDSAVRITHMPTGLVAQSQGSRSQAANKETALMILKSRLLKLLEDEQKAKVNDLRANVKEIAWGNQIRSYVFHPYKLVKDLRTGQETSNVSAVMDGELDEFIYANLRKIT